MQHIFIDRLCSEPHIHPSDSINTPQKVFISFFKASLSLALSTKFMKPMALFLPSKLAMSTAILSLLLLATFKPSLSYSHETTSISLAPSYLPKMPKISYMAPALSPDILPTFPSPGTATGEAPSSNLPTIPSSPSPPNPDDLEPNSAFAPFGSMATATSAAGSLGDARRVPVAFVSGFVVLLWWLVMGR